ncbi:hypothetical protein Q1695_008037 [Nippostrongylus brasiliensis]|nr:hypothetical protein Q1695_008037 [Nippostrongylus brasiliensis]
MFIGVGVLCFFSFVVLDVAHGLNDTAEHPQPDDDETTNGAEKPPLLSSKKLRVNFTSPSSVKVSFDDGKDGPKDCKVHLCDSPEISQACTSKSLKNDVLFHVKEGETTQYVSRSCKSDEKDKVNRSWVMFVGPTTSKKTVPTLIRDLGTGVKVDFTAEESVNFQLKWQYSLENGSVFKHQHVKAITVQSYFQGQGEAYVPKLLTKDITKREVGGGLSPGLKFMRGCIFFSLEVTYADETYTFNSTPESCYGIFSISYIVIYVVGVLAVIVTIYCIYVNYTAGKYADVIEEQSAEKKKAKKSSSSSSRARRRSSHRN